jgi:hypothetical protein
VNNPDLDREHLESFADDFLDALSKHDHPCSRQAPP